MDCKSELVRAARAAGDRIGALRIAARFFDRSIDTRTFKRGIDAYNNPSFYRKAGKEPKTADYSGPGIVSEEVQTTVNRAQIDVLMILTSRRRRGCVTAAR